MRCRKGFLRRTRRQKHQILIAGVGDGVFETGGADVADAGRELFSVQTLSGAREFALTGGGCAAIIKWDFK